MNNNELLKEKGFNLNTCPGIGKFWELETNDDELKTELCKIFGIDMDASSFDTIILQCTEDFTKCLFYCDYDLFDIEPETFLECVGNITIKENDYEK